jgi:hypothetical protein
VIQPQYCPNDPNLDVSGALCGRLQLREENRDMTALDFQPLSVAIALTEDPPGVFRVGNSRVLLELVLLAFLRGETPEAIVRSYRSLHLAEVYAVITRYLTDPEPFDEYLRQCDRGAAEFRRQVEATQSPQVSKHELLTRAKDKGLVP